MGKALRGGCQEIYFDICEEWNMGTAIVIC
jgi:hypothetical protein